MEQLLSHIYHRQSNPLHSIVNSDGKINKWSLPIEQELASAVIGEVLEYTYNNESQWKSEPGDHDTDHLRYKLPLPDSARGPALKELYTVYSENARPHTEARNAHYEFVSIVRPGGTVGRHNDVQHMKTPPKGSSLRKSRFSVQWPVDCDFRVDGVGRLDTRPGRVYLFDHCRNHWVENRSTDTDKIDLSIMINSAPQSARLNQAVLHSIEEWFEANTLTL